MSEPVSSDAPLREGRIEQLDGVRGLAIIMVLVAHFYVLLSEPNPAYPRFFSTRLLQATWSGVDLFFVLSGFLIGGILIDRRRSTNYYAVFYLRRTLRILPLYFVLLLTVGALALAAPDLRQLSTGEGESWRWMTGSLFPAWCYATFLQNFCMAAGDSLGSDSIGHSWSLAVEEQFYLLLPLFIRLVPERALPRLLAGLVLLTPLLRVQIWFIPDFGRIGAYVLLPCRADSLLLGVLSAWAVRQDSIRRFLAARRRALNVLLLVLSAIGAFFSYYDGNFSSFLMINVGYTWFAITFALLILLAIVSPRRSMLGFLYWTPLRWIGWVSYFVYLFHQLVLGFAYLMMTGEAPSFEHGYLPMVVALFLTFLLAGVSWRYFERPLLRYGHRYNYDMAP